MLLQFIGFQWICALNFEQFHAWGSRLWQFRKHPLLIRKRAPLEQMPKRAMTILVKSRGEFQECG